MLEFEIQPISEGILNASTFDKCNQVCQKFIKLGAENFFLQHDQNSIYVSEHKGKVLLFV